MICGVPQDSKILGPLLCNIFLADLFFIVSEIDIGSYTDNNNPYMAKNTVDDLIKSLEQVSNPLVDWFKNYCTKNEVFH